MDVATGVTSTLAKVRVERAKRLGLCVLSAWLWYLSCPQFHRPVLAWVAMVPLLFAIERTKTASRAFCYAWIAGTALNAGAFFWVAGVLRRYAAMPQIVSLGLLLLLSAYQGLIFAAFGGFVRTIRQRSNVPMAWVAPTVIVALEHAVPTIFPLSVSVTQAWQLGVIQIADVTGPAGVSFLLLAVNGAVYDLLLERRRRIVSSALAAAVLVATLAYGHERIAHFTQIRAAAPKINVGIVQPNTGFSHVSKESARRQMLILRNESRVLASQGADVILWPELSHPYFLDHDLSRETRFESPHRIRAEFSTPLLFGAPTRDYDSGSLLSYNTVMMLDRDGTVAGRHDKTALVPFAEYIPAVDFFPFIAKAIPPTAAQRSAGTSVDVFPYRNRNGSTYRLGPFICYEGITSDFSRRLASQRPHLLVNLANDAWAGGTAEPWEHLALNVYQSVQTRTDMVRAVTSGVSALISSTGQIVVQTYTIDPLLDPRDADHLLAQAPLVEGGHTVYAKIGDLFAYICSGTVLLLWFALPWIRARR